MIRSHNLLLKVENNVGKSKLHTKEWTSREQIINTSLSVILV
jgi:hypothetical protein